MQLGTATSLTASGLRQASSADLSAGGSAGDSGMGHWVQPRSEGQDGGGGGVTGALDQRPSGVASPADSWWGSRMGSLSGDLGGKRGGSEHGYAYGRASNDEGALASPRLRSGVGGPGRPPRRTHSTFLSLLLRPSGGGGLTPGQLFYGLRVRMGVASGNLQEGEEVANSAVFALAKGGWWVFSGSRSCARCPRSSCTPLPCPLLHAVTVCTLPRLDLCALPCSLVPLAS
jgi:hypothetical protein